MKNLVLSLVVVLGLGVGGVASAVNEWFGYIRSFDGVLFRSDQGYGSPIFAVNGAQCDAQELGYLFEGIDRFGLRPFDGVLYHPAQKCISPN